MSIETIECCADINSNGIKNVAKTRLEQEKSCYPSKASGLRSKLVRDYPTTLAVITASLNSDGSYTINSYWAGDSRNYLWTENGFYQISKDDLDTELDPLENLRSDGALSNCICADRDFSINEKELNVAKKFIILSASDGCFNYFTTPMHFHEVLLAGLQQAKNESEWEAYCKKKITSVAGDDISLSLMAIGYNGFHDLRDAFSKDKVDSVKHIRDAQSRILGLTNQLEEAKVTLENLIQSEWNNYKFSYLKYLREDNTDVDTSDLSVYSEQEPPQNRNEDEESVSCLSNNTIKDSSSINNKEGHLLKSTTNDNKPVTSFAILSNKHSKHKLMKKYRHHHKK